mmetsp:Transcript_24013/g.31931  ORF Transcript_24013/g.31931 Transcript_24013/m.31931 type:complete len:103 (-) Transcript_24013:155-463(-)
MTKEDTSDVQIMREDKICVIAAKYHNVSQIPLQFLEPIFSEIISNISSTPVCDIERYNQPNTSILLRLSYSPIQLTLAWVPIQSSAYGLSGSTSSMIPDSSA